MNLFQLVNYAKAYTNELHKFQLVLVKNTKIMNL